MNSMKVREISFFYEEIIYHSFSFFNKIFYDLVFFKTLLELLTLSAGNYCYYYMHTGSIGFPFVVAGSMHAVCCSLVGIRNNKLILPCSTFR